MHAWSKNVRIREICQRFFFLLDGWPDYGGKPMGRERGSLFQGITQVPLEVSQYSASLASSSAFKRLTY